MAPPATAKGNKNKQTRFPVARIKKIMQKDEDVGKVAHGTPVIISKALELFLAVVVEEASKVTRERGSKKVEAYHLKHAIETTGNLDFLKELVEGVADPSCGGTIDLEAQQAEAAAAKKKRGKGKGKKAKEEEEDDGEPKEPAPKRKRKTKAQVEQDKADKALAAAEKKAAAAAAADPQGSDDDQEMEASGDEDDDEPYMPPS